MTTPFLVQAARVMVEGFGSSAMRLSSGAIVRGLFRGPERMATDGGGALLQIEDTTFRCMAVDVQGLSRGALVQVTREDLGETTPRQYRVGMLQPVGNTAHVFVVLERTS